MSDTKFIAIIGNGGHAQDILSILAVQPNLDVVSFLLDDDPDKVNAPVRKDTGIYKQYLQLMAKLGPDLTYVIGVNSSQTRKLIAMQMDDICARPADPIIHPTASLGSMCSIHSGSVMGPYSVLTSNVKVGRHVHMNTASSINQGSTVGDYCTLSPGARICGDVKVGDTVSFGANSTVINLKTIADDVIVGAGAVVVQDIIHQSITVAGVPAKELKKK